MKNSLKGTKLTCGNRNISQRLIPRQHAYPQKDLRFVSFSRQESLAKSASVQGSNGWPSLT